MIDANNPWVSTTLGKICQINPSRPQLADLSDETPVLFVPMAAVDDVTGEITASEHRTLGEVRAKSFRTFAHDDVIFAKITPCMENGKSAVVPEIASGIGFGSTEFHVLRPNASVNPRFIWHYLRQESFRQSAKEQMTGSVGQARVPATYLENFPILLPPETTQNSIVEVLDNVILLKLSATAHLRNANRAIERFRQAVLAAACSGRLTKDWREDHNVVLANLPSYDTRRPKQLRNIESYNLDELPEGWIWIQVENLLPPGGIFDGPFGSNLKTSDYTATGARVIRLENIGHLKFIGDKQTFVSTDKYLTLVKHAVYPGDIVFSSFVEEQVRVCVLPENLDAKTLAKADCFTIRPTQVIDRHYLALQLASQLVFRLISSQAACRLA